MDAHTQRVSIASMDLDTRRRQRLRSPTRRQRGYRHRDIRACDGWIGVDRHLRICEPDESVPDIVAVVAWSVLAALPVLECNIAVALGLYRHQQNLLLL